MTKNDTASPQDHPSIPTDNNEIDLIKIIKYLIANKWLFVILLVIGIGSASLYNKYSQPKYGASTTFFLSDTDSNPLSAISFLGGSNKSAIDRVIFSVLQSNTIQTRVAETLFKNHPKFIQHILAPYPENLSMPEKLVAIKSELKLYKWISIDQNFNQLFTIYFEYTDPEITLATINAYMAHLLDLNSELEISAQKNFITTLDPSELLNNGHPIKPKKAQNLALGILLSLLTSIVIIAIKALKSPFAK